MKNKRNLLAICITVLSVVLSVVGFLVLPDRVTVNISFEGAAQYTSKYFALAIPLVIACVCSLIYAKYHSFFGQARGDTAHENERERSTEKSYDENDIKQGTKFIIFAIVGILLTLWAIIRNI